MVMCLLIWVDDILGVVKVWRRIGLHQQLLGFHEWILLNRKESKSSTDELNRKAMATGRGWGREMANFIRTGPSSHPERRKSRAGSCQGTLNQMLYRLPRPSPALCLPRTWSLPLSNPLSICTSCNVLGHWGTKLLKGSLLCQWA